MWTRAVWRNRPDLDPTPWHSDGGRPRVLIEHHDSTIGVAVGNLLASEGYDVSTCGGPNDRRNHQCPLASGGDCPSADDADVIFFGLDISDEDDREVLRAWRSRHADIPVVVEMPLSRIPLYRDELLGCIALGQPMTRDTLLDAVQQALSIRRR